VHTYNVTVFVAACVGVVLFLYNPDRIWLIILAEIVFASFLWLLAMRPVHEPDRAVVYRLAQFHHIAGPGRIFLVPTLDHIEGVLDMTPQETGTIEVPQIRTADGESVRTNLEISWRIHPEVQGRVSPKVREMLMMADERRKTLVSETMILTARQVIFGYAAVQLGTTPAREAATADIMRAANERLNAHGILVDRVFWRGSMYPLKLTEAKLEGAIRLERTQTLIAMIEAFKKRLPEMQPEEIMALDAWLDTFGRGGSGKPPASAS
jgi:regulator of protease activity HflC (stomatin/prohibitin superfamily)